MTLNTLVWALGALLYAEWSNAAASVYLRPSTTSGSSNPSPLSGSDADVLLAHHLGLEPAYAQDGASLEKLLESAGGQVSLGETLLDSAEDSLLVVVDANNVDLDELLPETWAFPTFTTEKTGSFWSSLSNSYTSTASNTDFQVYEVPEEGHVPPHQLLDFFDFAAESPAAEAFVKSFNSLVEFVEGDGEGKRRFGAFSLSTLPVLAEQYGQDSDAFTAITLAVRSTLRSASLRGLNLAVVVDSSSTTPLKWAASAPESTQAPFPAPPGNAPIFSTSTCYTSANKCKKGTTECSGRGQCVPVRKGPKECFVCQCAVTKDAKNRREYWSGSSCQTKDVSTAFTLVTGTTIAIVLVIIFAISLLYSVGNEELPNVLTGGAVHAKHD